jgi:YhcH/YjgK/YiaL family protein
MIVDRIERKDTYNGLVPYWKEAFEFAMSLKDQPVGRYECESLPAGAVFALVQEGQTMPYGDGKLEAHRRYMDVQIMLEGGETVYYMDVEGLEPTIPYKDDADIEFFGQCGQPAEIKAGMFYAVMPHDGHMPCRELDGPGSFRKVVLKIRVCE